MPRSSLLRPLAGLAAFAAVVLMADPASAQMRTERVRFARGASETTVSAQHARGAARRYLVGAQRGQTVRVELDGSSSGTQCSLGVYAPGRAVRDSYALASSYDDNPSTRARRNAWSGTLSRSGDYQIVVTNRGQSGTCGLFVSVN